MDRLYEQALVVQEALDAFWVTDYLGQLSKLRPYLQEAMIDVMKAQGVRRLILSQTERSILATLARMVPTTAEFYQQVLQDIAGGNRVSWRGTGGELREVLPSARWVPDD